MTEALANAEGPIVAVTDFMKAVPDQVARWVPAPFISLGTDGFGRSDTREALRRYFETDAAHVVVAALDGLRQAGEGKAEEVEDAIRRYGIDPDCPDPARDSRHRGRRPRPRTRIDFRRQRLRFLT